MEPTSRPGLLTRAGVHRMLEGTPAHPVRRAVRIGLAVLVLLNVLAVVVESVPSVGADHARTFWWFEAFSVAVFTIEYVLRVWSCVEDPRYAGPRGRLRFAMTPMAVIDLLAVMPFYAAAILPLDMRMLRVVRLLRIFKLSRHSTSMDLLLSVVRQEASSMVSAMLIMAVVILLAASGIYLIERGAQPAFDSIPKAIWWASVTLTTVGYGDVVPVTVAGKLFGLLITIAGVGMVALPAGILASGFSLELQRRREAFRLQVRLASDARTPAAKLEAKRDELGLTEEEADVMVEAARAERSDRAELCPHCGGSLRQA